MIHSDSCKSKDATPTVAKRVLRRELKHAFRHRTILPVRSRTLRATPPKEAVLRSDLR
ncbi:hypothetical protein DPMN_183085 [Dreissena polymorpha]|uniref:Uncharacterized protein n=1 Tax=Dreissena polymorpha TaxID=45954 RepID=A0A9D4DGR2_DREPO|nr:hypothetical protein DPMN_183085 [Dreissena polymorpha]